MVTAGVPIGGIARRAHPIAGLRPAMLFFIVGGLTTAYVWFDVAISAPWRDELARAFGPAAAWIVPSFLAYIPGIVIGFYLFTLLLTTYVEQTLTTPDGTWPALTVLIAAWNEQDAISATIEAIAAANYPGPLEVVLADNNSTDHTAQFAEQVARRHGVNYRRVFEQRPGKHHALNAALKTVTTPLMVTVDADTYPHVDSLTRLVASVTDTPQGQHVSAVAGALFVDQPGRNLVTRMQDWDYRLAINGVKRMQAAYNTTLVAQGAFSVYWTEDVRDAGGWPDAIGEDIVLTWRLLRKHGIVRYEPLAVAFTAAPDKAKHLMLQRSRWARGMFEGLRMNPPARQPRVLAKFVASVDYLVPLLDVGYIFFWIPGLLLFLAGKPIIFGWWSMLLIPVTWTIYTLMRRWQERHVLTPLGIEFPRDRSGFWVFLFLYQGMTSAASLRGYAQFLVGSGRRWR
jgi:biofilm PGA synthesis N-glycosyltransferase PgaC